MLLSIVATVDMSGQGTAKLSCYINELRFI